MRKEDKIFISGRWPMVDMAIYRYLKHESYKYPIVSCDIGLDLTNQSMVSSFFKKEKPDYVFLTTGMHGGILANRNHSAEFIYDNLQIQTNIIHYAKECKVKKLIFLGSSCVYPKDCPQPMKEKYLLSGKLEEISQYYAMSKLAGIMMCQAYNTQYKTRFISAIPATVYGPGDDFDLKNSHVLSALLKKIDMAKENNESKVTLWGNGLVRREFLYVDDLARVTVFLMQHHNESGIINIGSGSDISIKELAELIKEIVGFKGKIVYDKSKPSGIRRKLLDISQIIKLGWKPEVNLKEGIILTYQWYKKHFSVK